MPSDLPKQILMIVNAYAPELQRQAALIRQADAPDALMTAENGMAALAQELADDLTAKALKAKLSEPAFQAEATAAAYAGPIRYRSGGRRTVEITLRGGMVMDVAVPYLKPDRRGRPGRKRRKRGKGGTGLYPTLAALGIWHGMTPALSEEICYHVTVCDSVRVARAMLARRDIDPGHKRTLRLVNHVGRRLVAQREHWLQAARRRPATTNGSLSGKRVVVATDGGRIRGRLAKPGRPRDNGHRSYETPWSEPKVLSIHIIGADGRIDRSFQPVYDATLGDCNATFDMILSYLRALGAQDAALLLLIGDGAHWIWNEARVARLVTGLGIPPTRVEQLIDWFHAVEKLGEIAKVPKWSGSQQERWLRRAKRNLWRGNFNALLRSIDDLAVGRRARAIKKHRPYFADNIERMQYSTFAQQGLPTGSGPVESAIRRIVNQRIKAPGTFWIRENAEHMLLMRSYLKSGRWHSLFSWSFATAASWWPPTHASRDPSIGPLAPPPQVSDATLRGYA